MSELMFEKELRVRLKLAQIRTLKRDMGRLKSLFEHTGKEYFAQKCSAVSKQIVCLSYDLEYLRDLKLSS